MTAAQTVTAQSAQRPPLLLPEDAGFVATEIPGLRKAAILLVALGDDLAKTFFTFLAFGFPISLIGFGITRLLVIRADRKVSE